MLPRTFSSPAREATVAWVLVLGALALVKPVLPGAVTGALAVAAFLWVPGWMNRRAGREDEDYGLTRERLGRDVLVALACMAIVFPLFVWGFRAFLDARTWLPEDWARLLTPYGQSRGFEWRLPDRLLDRVGGNIAVAIGEEFFYRGYMLKRFEERWPPATKLLGAPFGKAMWLQTALFALGHLLTPDAFRLGTFFPGLLFGWLAARTGRIVAPAIVHASSNLLIATLEASAFGP